MCGIAGFFGGKFHDTNHANSIAMAMATSIAHRGPNDSGVWVDVEDEIAMSHRRLSILDLSPAGSQPMKSNSGNFVIIFNGEIYNHMDLRREIGEFNWSGHSDTETLLAAIEKWGLKTALKKSVGMFAFALWDRRGKELTLARDRIGEKPLFYGQQGGSFLFASELKALSLHPEFEGGVDRRSLDFLLRYGYIPSPYSIHRNIHKLPPGTFLKIKRGIPNGNLPIPEAYWSLSEIIASGGASRFEGTEKEAIQELESLLRRAVHGQMQADVPHGAFLSGGIDSSTIVALMQAQSGKRVKTFTIGFGEKKYNEAEHAKAVAKYLGTEHTELYVDHRRAREIIPELPKMFDEPLGDASAIPMFFLSQLTRKHVTISLSGDGGDELFGGYSRYVRESDFWKKLSLLPLPLRKISKATAWKAVKCLRSLKENRKSPENTKNIFRSVDNLINRTRALAACVGASDFHAFYGSRLAQWSVDEGVVEGVAIGQVEISDDSLGNLSMEERMMFYDAKTFLPDSVLCKVDRAAMAVGLESRAPFLDHRVVEFAAKLPLGMKIRGGCGKWIVREILHRHVPAPLVERPKMGFGVPVGTWLRGPLRDWGEWLLDENRLRNQGYFRSSLIRERWCQHLRGLGDWQNSLWSVLMFQSWLEQRMKK